MTSHINVEVVFATAKKQALLAVLLPYGATVGDALSQSGLEKQFPNTDFSTLQLGIWGQVVTRDKLLTDGDRVEIYRPLELDPKEARRQLASLGLTMSGGSKNYRSGSSS